MMKLMNDLRIIILILAITIAIDIAIKFIKWVNENDQRNIKDFYTEKLKGFYDRYFIVWLLITIPIALLIFYKGNH